MDTFESDVPMTHQVVGLTVLTSGNSPTTWVPHIAVSEFAVRRAVLKVGTEAEKCHERPPSEVV
jgi:hypothetical protein